MDAIEFEIPDPKRASPLGTPPAETDTNPGQQLRPGEWLGEIVVGARIEPANPIIDRPAPKG